MTEYDRWYPGPTEAEEISSIASLRDAISSQFFADPVKDGSEWPGAPVSGYGFYDFGYQTSPSGPYLAGSWWNGTHILRLKFRYSAALNGTMDPSVFFPGCFASLATYTQAQMQIAAGGSGRLPFCMQQVADSINLSDLTQASIGRSVGTLDYTHGPRDGQTFGVRWDSDYAPSAGEVTTSGFPGSWQQAIIAATDAFDGTIAVFSNVFNSGPSLEQVPVVVVQQGDQQAGWDDLSGGIGDIKDSIDNALPKYDDIKEALDKTSIVDRADTVTHPSDVGGAGDVAADTPVPGVSVFGVPGAGPAIAAGGATTALALSGTRAIIVAGYQMTAAVCAGILSIGLLDKVKAGWDVVISALPGIGNVSTAVTNLVNQTDQLQDFVEQIGTNTGSQATTQQAQADALNRIADALEDIRDELVGNPADQKADPGIVTATELASQARSEIEASCKGVHFIASTGIAYEEG